MVKNSCLFTHFNKGLPYHISLKIIETVYKLKDEQTGMTRDSVIAINYLKCMIFDNTAEIDYV